MRALMQNAALAEKSWKAPTSGRTYAIDAQGLGSIHADRPEKGTKDHTEAVEAGFKPYDPGSRVALKNPAFGKTKIAKEVDGDIEIVETGAQIWTAQKTHHHYHADDTGRIDVFTIDVDEAKAAGFAPA